MGPRSAGTAQQEANAAETDGIEPGKKQHAATAKPPAMQSRGEAAPGKTEATASLSAADPWWAVLEASAAGLQSLATARASADATGAAPMAIERDPMSGQMNVRVPLPDPAVQQRLAKAFEPWLR